MIQRKQTIAMLFTLTAAAAGACDRPSPTIAEPSLALAPSFHVGCPAGDFFTGGGRIDPNGEMITFGFNVRAGTECEGELRGQLQVVHHPTQTKFHSTSITRFSSFEDADGARCAEWEGTVRAMHANGDWHDHDFFADACDRGEPGSSPDVGPDTFRFNAAGAEGSHANTGRVPLTGGNIQAH